MQNVLVGGVIIRTAIMTPGADNTKVVVFSTSEVTRDLPFSECLLGVNTSKNIHKVEIRLIEAEADCIFVPSTGRVHTHIQFWLIYCHFTVVLNSN